MAKQRLCKNCDGPNPRPRSPYCCEECRWSYRKHIMRSKRYA